MSPRAEPEPRNGAPPEASESAPLGIDLGARLAALAGGLDDVEIADEGGVPVHRRAGQAFAVLGQPTLEFRLDRAIAAAAVRTPDTSHSRRGPGWIGFRPLVVDGHALDRAEAWLTSAWRHAGPGVDPD
jgi:hypothetical protein